MKKIVFIILLFCVNISVAQTETKIDISNYYNFYSEDWHVTTDALRLKDVVPIMLEELKKAGYDWLYDRTMYKLENGQLINISAYSRKSNIGFLYLEGHSVPLNKKARDVLFQKDNSNVNFTECTETFSGKAEFEKITALPSNIFILNEDSYFFQYSDNKEYNKNLVTKEIAIEILRQDIKRYLSTAPKPN